jgi:hypothetical protein
MGEPKQQQSPKHRLREAVKQCIVLKDDAHDSLSIFCRNPGNLATILEALDSSYGSCFAHTEGLITNLRKIDATKRCENIDLSLLQDPHFRKYHADFLDTVSTAQPYADIMLVDLPSRHGKTAHIKRARDTMNCSAETTTLFGVTMEHHQRMLHGEAVIALLEEYGLRKKLNVATVKGNDDPAVACRNVLMALEGTVRK